MSVDSERIFFAVINGPWILVAPLSFIVTIVLIGVMFDGVSAVCGAALLVIVLYTSLQLAEHIGAVQKELLQVAEERVKVTSEALQGIRVMKFYAWEESLATRVERIRAAEIKFYRKFHYLQITNTILLFLTPVFLGGLVMGIYVGLNGTVTVTDAYTIINVVNITRLAVNMFPSPSPRSPKLQSRIDAWTHIWAAMKSRVPVLTIPRPQRTGRLRPKLARSQFATRTSRGLRSLQDPTLSWSVLPTVTWLATSKLCAAAARIFT